MPPRDWWCHRVLINISNSQVRPHQSQGRVTFNTPVSHSTDLDESVWVISSVSGLIWLKGDFLPWPGAILSISLFTLPRVPEYEATFTDYRVSRSVYLSSIETLDRINFQSMLIHDQQSKGKIILWSSVIILPIYIS